MDKMTDLQKLAAARHVYVTVNGVNDGFQVRVTKTEAKYLLRMKDEFEVSEQNAEGDVFLSPAYIVENSAFWRN